MQNARKTELGNIFDFYDSSRDGSINTEEFKELLNDISGDGSLTLDIGDVAMFVHAMDANGDGKLGRDEFLDYLLRGMSMTTTERVAFSKRSAMHAALQSFVNNILVRLEEA